MTQTPDDRPRKDWRYISRLESIAEAADQLEREINNNHPQLQHHDGVCKRLRELQHHLRYYRDGLELGLWM